VCNVEHAAEVRQHQKVARCDNEDGDANAPRGVRRRDREDGPRGEIHPDERVEEVTDAGRFRAGEAEVAREEREFGEDDGGGNDGECYGENLRESASSDRAATESVMTVVGRVSRRGVSRR